MRLLALVPGPFDTIGSQRYRLEQWQPWLAERGVEITYEPFATPELLSLLHAASNGANDTRKNRYQETRRFAQLFYAAVRRRMEVVKRVTNYDVVYVCREAVPLGSPFIERRIARRRVPIVFDFDDAIFKPHLFTHRWRAIARYLIKDPAKTKKICSLAAHVMAGNRYLADFAGQFNSHTSVVPTTIDIDKYVPPTYSAAHASQDVHEKIVIGWSGSFSTVPDLDFLRGALQRLAKLEDFRLRVIGAPDYRLPGVEVEAVAWRSVTEVEDLQALDIGIMPLPDTEWNRGKCGAKALQYMGLGIATICSPVGVNREIVSDGINGLHATTEDEWVEKLRMLVRSPHLRQTFGAAGRRTIEERYSAQIHAPRVYAILQSVVGRSAPESFCKNLFE